MHLIGRRRFGALSAALLAATGARADTAPLRIGVLTDETGPYADSGGAGSILAARMAAADFGGSVLDRKIEILHADHQNKADIASAIAQRWYDSEGVEAITDLPVTSTALAVQQVAKQRQKTVMITAAATSDLTSRLCSPTSSHWADDTHALTAGTARAVLAEGAMSWFFITVDYAFGLALQRDATAVIDAAGGKVLGASRYALGTTDYSALLLAAQNSGAKAIGLASVGGDLINLIKQAAEFGLLRQGGPTIVAFLTYITDIHALGLRTTQGLTFSAGFYWDQNDAARAWAQRFAAEHHAMPTKNQATIYAAVSHYLKSMQQAASSDNIAVNKAMRELPVAFYGHPASVRADGRVLYDLTLYRVKTPAESKSAWDCYTALRTVPAAEAFLPMSAVCTA